MRKVGILVLVCLLLATGIMAAMAYTKAEVTNPMALTIKNTNESLLAIVPNTGVGHADATAVTDSGKLVLNFAAGNGGNFGFQPGSQYTFKDLFFVKNNSSDTIKMGLRFDSVYVGDKGPTGLHTVSTNKSTGFSSYGNALMHFNGGTFTGGWYDGRYITLAPGEEIGITWDYNLKSINAVTGPETWVLQVHAEP
ncbi:MAG: hypothetical protein NUK65_12020, partial [Firmicutes bacterium]|nr:hypothetical protein [Bacillota bacterium]